MKSLYLHKKSVLFSGILTISILILLVFLTTCEIGEIGLGLIVNTEKPVIANAGEENVPGSFMQGTNNTIELDVQNRQGFKIETVSMEVEYVDLNGETKRKTVPAYKDPATGNWLVDLDVSEMEDGRIKAWVTAVDESGNETTSTEITYFVKNKPPQVKLTLPSIADDDFDSVPYLNDIIDNDQIYIGMDIMGLATDDYGIMDGFPKIKFWPKSYEDFLDIDGIPTQGMYSEWRTAELPMNYKAGSTVAKFTYPLANLIEEKDAYNNTIGWRLPKRLENGKHDELEYKSLPVNVTYRFQVWVRDGWGNDNFYPNRSDNKRGIDGTADDPDNAPRKYIEVYHRAVGDRPIIQVPNMPRYYNKVGNFNVDISVLSSDPDFKTGHADLAGHAVEVYINTSSSTTAKDMGPFYPATSTASSPYTYNLSIPYNDPRWGSLEGTRYISVKAKDHNGQEGAPFVQYFILDFVPPVVTFDQPSTLVVKSTSDITGGKYTILYPPSVTGTRPKWVTGTVTAGGKSSDTNGISKVYYHLGKLGDDNSSNPASIYSSASWIDTGLGTQTPATGWEGSIYAWTFKKSYPEGFKDQNTGLVQELSETALNPADTSNYATLGRERFYLPLYVKVVDVAENVHYVHYKLSIDPKLDEPNTSYIYPDENAIVGGTVRLSGNAEDNIWMKTVLMRIHKDGAVTPNYWYIPPDATLFYPKAGYPIPSAFPGMPGAASDGWFETKIYGEGPIVSWVSAVNADGKLNPDSGDTVNVTLQAVSIDCENINDVNPHIVGPIEQRIVRFSSKVPTINNVTITKGTNIRDYYEGISSSGNFVISMNISALDGINKVLAKVNNDPQVNLMSNNAPQMNGAIWNITNPTPLITGQRANSTLTITVDSTSELANAIVKGIGYGKTGIMTLEITVEDKTAQNFTSTYSYRIGIDNFYPSAVIETATSAYDDIKPSDPDYPNKFFLVQGTATDSSASSGVLQGLERVLVYFEEAQINYPGGVRTVTGNQRMRNPSFGIATTTEFEAYPVMDTARAGWTSTMTEPNAKTGFVIPKLVKNASGVWTSTAAMVIDYPENDPKEDGDNDGTYGERWAGQLDKTWQARMMISNRTTGIQQFPDGPYIVHYIVMDTAGNATHYQKDIYVENNKPRITGINIGTDIDFNGTVTDWISETNPGEYRDQSYNVDTSSEGTGRIVTSDSVFRVRNNRLGLRLTLDRGNGQKKVKVSYVTRAAGTTPATNIVKGNVYQIATTSANTEFTKFGAPNNYQNTVFVATGKGEGSGTVYQYNTVTTQAAQNMPTGSTHYTFNSFGGVTDTTTGLFLVKVYDSTVSTGGSPTQGAPDLELDQLASAVLLTISVNNTDSTPPKIAVGDFGIKYETLPMGNPQNYEENMPTPLTNANYSDYVVTDANGTKEGYVQYQSDCSPSTKAYISGKVIFNGKVTDNHRINRISVQITNGSGGTYNNGAEFDIATRNATGQLQAAASNINGEREFRIVSTVPQLSLTYGHTLVWQFIWDSSKILNQAATNVNITFRVYDSASPTALSASTIKNVDIIPYISEVKTLLSDAYSTTSVFNRSALGGYPVREGEPITIYGFNLGTAVGNAAIGATALSGGSNNGSAITSTVPSAAVSGNLVVTVNSIASFNNRTERNKNIAYNKEANGVNNNVLDNSRYMYVWNTGYIYNTDIPNISNPFMRMDNNANRYLSYGYYPQQSNGRLRVLKNNNNYDIGTAFSNRMVYTTVATGKTNDSFYAMGTDLSSSVADNRGFQFGMSNSAGTGSINGTVTGAANGSINIFNTSNSNPDRFRIPRIAVQPTGGGNRGTDRVLISYFDEKDKYVKIIYGYVDATTATNISNSSSEIVAANTTDKKGSVHTAVGFLSNGVPLISWYDSQGQKLYLSWGSGTPTSNLVSTNTDAGYYYTSNGHGLTTGTDNTDIILAGTASPPLTKYYVTSTTANNFSISTTAGGAIGQDCGASINFTPHIAVPTAQGTNNDGTTGNTQYYTFDSDYGLVTGDAVNIIYINGAVQQYVVRNVYYSATNSNYRIKFATNSTTNTAGDFFNAATSTANCANVFVYPAKLTKTAARTNITTNTWQTNAKEIDTGRGSHVDMAVDGGNNVHLAYYGDYGGLYYAYIPYDTATSRPKFGDKKTVRVDTFLSAGTKIMINIRQETTPTTRYVPYISYAHAAFPGTKNTIRVAWRVDFSTIDTPPNSTDIGNKFDGTWEVMTIPVSGNVIPNTDEFVCNGVPTASTWTLPGGTSTLTYNTNLNQTIILGYMTNIWYEGAILKGDIRDIPAILKKTP
jgi:hypothetical protein